MGDVYRSTDTRLGRPVAIKVLHPHVARDADGRVRFAREARAASALSHPNICMVYDVGATITDQTAEPVSYLVLEYLEGETLAARWRSPTPFSMASRYSRRWRRSIARRWCIATSSPRTSS